MKYDIRVPLTDTVREEFRVILRKYRTIDKTAEYLGTNIAMVNAIKNDTATQKTIDIPFYIRFCQNPEIKETLQKIKQGIGGLLERYAKEYYNTTYNKARGEVVRDISYALGMGEKTVNGMLNQKPGRKNPPRIPVSIALYLASEIGIVGNGAGYSDDIAKHFGYIIKKDRRKPEEDKIVDNIEPSEQLLILKAISSLLDKAKEKGKKIIDLPLINEKKEIKDDPNKIESMIRELMPE